MAGIRRPGIDGSFLVFWGINLILNWEGLIPAAICLVLHFVIGLSLKWFFILLALWFVIVSLIYFVFCKLMSMDTGSSSNVRTPEEQAEHDRRLREYSRSLGEKKPMKSTWKK